MVCMCAVHACGDTPPAHITIPITHHQHTSPSHTTSTHHQHTSPSPSHITSAHYHHHHTPPAHIITHHHHTSPAHISVTLTVTVSWSDTRDLVGELGVEVRIMSCKVEQVMVDLSVFGDTDTPCSCTSCHFHWKVSGEHGRFIICVVDRHNNLHVNGVTGICNNSKHNVISCTHAYIHQCSSM